MVVGFTHAIIDTTLYDKVCSELRQVGGFPPSNLVSSTNKSDNHDIIEILLKMVLNAINPIQSLNIDSHFQLDVLNATLCGKFCLVTCEVTHICDRL